MNSGKGNVQSRAGELYHRHATVVAHFDFLAHSDGRCWQIIDDAEARDVDVDFKPRIVLYIEEGPKHLRSLVAGSSQTRPKGNTSPIGERRDGKRLGIPGAVLAFPRLNVLIG